MSSTVVHKACGHVFDKGYVMVISRYADCSTFNCPGCGAHIDDRPGLHLRPAREHDEYDWRRGIIRGRDKRTA